MKTGILEDMSDVVQRIAMKAVIIKDGKVLVLREAGSYQDGTQGGRYQIPGGRIEAGENHEDALKREVKEETGLEIAILMPIYVGEWRPVIRDVPHQIVATYIVCKPLSSDVKLSEEHDRFEWISPADRGKYDIVDPESLVIERFAELNSKGVFA